MNSVSRSRSNDVNDDQKRRLCFRLAFCRNDVLREQWSDWTVPSMDFRIRWSRGIAETNNLLTTADTRLMWGLQTTVELFLCHRDYMAIRDTRRATEQTTKRSGAKLLFEIPPSSIYTYCGLHTVSGKFVVYVRIFPYWHAGQFSGWRWSFSKRKCFKHYSCLHCACLQALCRFSENNGWV